MLPMHPMHNGGYHAKRISPCIFHSTGRYMRGISGWPSSRRRQPIKSGGDGVQQAKEYAEMLGLKFAYATNADKFFLAEGGRIRN